jgi:chorismate mutase
MDGLMIETHINPDKALTDTSQQASPQELKDILANLVKRENQAESDATLEKYRTTIDELDEQLLEILARRMNISEQIGKLKKEQNLAPFQADRWQALLDDRNKKGEKLKLNSDFIKKVFEAIHMESIRRQE